MYWKEKYLQKAQDFKKLAEGMGVTASQLALAWVIRRSEVTSAIMGATNVKQVEDNAGAAAVKIPQEVLTKIDGLFPGPGESYPI